MSNTLKPRERLNRIYFFFPFQLVLLHFKKNHLLLFFWFLLFAYITGSLGSKYGIHILFLYPEYLGENNIWSFGILGFSIGGFTTAFNLYSYIMHGFRFPFIASISRPFVKFSINNFIIPTVFISTYIYYSLNFQMNKEFVPLGQALLNVSAFVGGIVLFTLLAFAYFLQTNKDADKLSEKRKAQKAKKEALDEQSEEAKKNVKSAQRRWANLRQANRTWRVETYLFSPIKIQLARNSRHYKDEVLAKVLSQNHINASIFEIIVITTFFLIGTLRVYDVFLIPAGASIFLLFTMFLMIISALFNWFKGWTLSVLILCIIGANYLSSKGHLLYVETHALGLHYKTGRVPYKDYLNNKLPSDSLSNAYKQQYIQVLNNWKADMQKEYGVDKPKIIFLNSSGGGSRSSLWTYRCLTYLDSVTNGSLYEHTRLICGSSGGMIGQSVYREQKRLRIFEDSILNTKEVYHNLGKDILNPIAMSLVTNDLFIRYQRVNENGERYIKDRGIAFEEQLNKNLNNLLKGKQLKHYAEYEQKGQLPWLIYTPVIINDGKKLLISSSSMPFLTVNSARIEDNIIPENIDFQHLFKGKNPDDLMISSALRMTATFPYILPSVNLPTEPTIDVMDSGLRDNYGLTTTISFINTFKEWIEENTSGILIIQLRDLTKRGNFTESVNESFITRLVSPIGNVYGNLFNTHNYVQDEMFLQLKKGTKTPVDLVAFELPRRENSQISLSFHLTQLEKTQIKEGIYFEANQKSVEKLKSLLPISKP